MANTIAFYTSLAEINRKVCTDTCSNPHHNVQDPIVKHILHFCSNQTIGYMLQ